MTNRGYLRGLSNEKLAELIFSKKEEICDSMKTCCCNNCLECIKKWLEMERTPKVEKWQIRKEPYQGCLWLILYVNEENGIHDWCMGVDEHGHISNLEVDVVRTWTSRDVENKENAVDKFLEMVFENLWLS